MLSNIKTISMPRHKNRFNFDPDAKLKTSHFWPIHKIQVNPAPPHSEIKSTSTTHTTKSIPSHTGIKSGSIPAIKVNLEHPHQILSCMVTPKTSDILLAYKTKSISTTHTTKSISSLNQVMFDPPHRNQVNLNPPHKNQVNFPAQPKTKWFSASILITSQFLPPTQPKQFSPYSEIMSKFDSPHWDQVRFDHHRINQSISMLTLETSNFRPAH